MEESTKTLKLLHKDINMERTMNTIRETFGIK